MAPLMMVAGLVGTGLQVLGTIKSGADQKAALNFEAAQHEQQGAADLAASQRAALDKTREGDLALSSIRATAADSGAGVVTPSILSIFGDVAEKANVNARTDLYAGQNKQAGEMDAAAANRAKGKSIYQGSILSGFGQGLASIGKLYNPGGTSGASGASYG